MGLLSSKKADDYDPATCITAGEFRAMGVTIDARVPDCAWVPKASISWAAGEAKLSENGRLSMSVHGGLSQPFRWIVVHVAATIG